MAAKVYGRGNFSWWTRNRQGERLEITFKGMTSVTYFL
jgi:hypothetical protein